MLDWLVRVGKDLVFMQNSGYSEKNLSYPPGKENDTIKYDAQCILN